MDNLDELERIFVQDFGKKCLKVKQTVDSNRLLNACLKQVPTFFSWCSNPEKLLDKLSRIRFI
jgi:hypothetical protein